jgi:hypothetical protein
MGQGRGRGRPEDSLLSARSGSPGPALALVGVMVLVTGCQDVTVQSVPVTSIEIFPASITVLEGEEVSLAAALRGPGGEVLGGRQVTWSTADPGVADLPTQGRLRGIAPGNTQLRVLSDGVQATAPVTVLQGPFIALSTSSVSLAGQLGTDTEVQAAVGISNSGNGPLSDLSAQVSVAGGGAANWLQAELSSSAAPSELRLRAPLEGLAPGNHQAAVQVSSAVAGNSPRTVQVTLQVRDAPPSIGLSPGSLAFGTRAGSFEPASQTVQVTNVGGGILDGLQVEVILLGGTTVNWLTAELAAAGAPTTLALEASARMLAAGAYRARVRVSSTVATPASYELEVTFNVSAVGGVRDPPVGRSPQAPGLSVPGPERELRAFPGRDVDPPGGTR